MAIRLPPLTARDKQVVRAAYRRIDEAYDSGRSRDTAETVMLSSGYAQVQYWPDDTHVTVWRHGQPTVVSTTGPKKTGAKRKAGSKTSARKRVPSKRVANPGRKKAKATNARAKSLYNSIERRVWEMREDRGDSLKFLPRDFRQLRQRAFDELSRGEYPSLAALDRANERARDAGAARYGKVMAKRDARGQFVKKGR